MLSVGSRQRLEVRQDLELPSVRLPKIPLIRILTPCSRCLGGKFDCSPCPSSSSRPIFLIPAAAIAELIDKDGT